MSSFAQSMSQRRATFCSAGEPKLPLLSADTAADASLRITTAEARMSLICERASSAKPPAQVSLWDCSATSASGGHDPIMSCSRMVLVVPRDSHHLARAAHPRMEASQVRREMASVAVPSIKRANSVEGGVGHSSRPASLYWKMEATRCRHSPRRGSSTSTSKSYATG